MNNTIDIITDSSRAVVTVSNVSSLAGIRETFSSPSISSGTVNVNLSTETIVRLALTGNVTNFAINNLSLKAHSFTLIVIPNGNVYTITWDFGSIVKWPGGTAPTLTTTNGKFDIFTFIYDGNNWYGFNGGQNF